MHLCRHIHANPVRHGLTPSLDDRPYSNYAEWVGARGGHLADRDWIRLWFAEPDLYVGFVSEYVAGLDALPTGIGRYLLEP